MSNKDEFYIVVYGSDFQVRNTKDGAIESTHGSLTSAKSRCSFLGTSKPEVVTRREYMPGVYDITPHKGL